MNKTVLTFIYFCELKEKEFMNWFLEDMTQITFCVSMICMGFILIIIGSHPSYPLSNTQIPPDWTFMGIGIGLIGVWVLRGLMSLIVVFIKFLTSNWYKAEEMALKDLRRKRWKR